MRIPPDIVRQQFERGVFILSIDTEQIWGYADYLTDAQFLRRFPGSRDAHQELLARLCGAGISATWFVVGGMALPGSSGPDDPRFAGLPRDWVARIPAGNEATMPLWYRESFVERLHRARPQQEIALHGGLTHFIWTDARATRDVVAWELAEGVHALQRLGIQPRSFSHGRNQEAHLDLLPAHGIRVFRGRLPVLAWELGQSLPGAVVRMVEEMRRVTPPPVWLSERLPGLWTLPSSTFLYPIGPARARIVGLRSRIERFTRGLEAAARHRGIFHFSLHPENLAESPLGFPLLEEMLDRLTEMRNQGDVEVLTVAHAAERMEHIACNKTAGLSLASECNLDLRPAFVRATTTRNPVTERQADGA